MNKKEATVITKEKNHKAIDIGGVITFQPILIFILNWILMLMGNCL